MSTIPTIHELDANGEATGFVYHFCCDHCRDIWRDNAEEPFAETEDSEAELILGDTCTMCDDVFLQPMHRAAQYIGEAAVQAETAYASGDYDTLKACLEAIQHYARDLGYQPERTTTDTPMQEEHTA